MYSSVMASAQALNGRPSKAGVIGSIHRGYTSSSCVASTTPYVVSSTPHAGRTGSIISSLLISCPGSAMAVGITPRTPTKKGVTVTSPHSALGFSAGPITRCTLEAGAGPANGKVVTRLTSSSTANAGP